MPFLLAETEVNSAVYRVVLFGVKIDIGQCQHNDGNEACYVAKSATTAAKERKKKHMLALSP
jgi:hypothetical protein